MQNRLSIPAFLLSSLMLAGVQAQTPPSPPASPTLQSNTETRTGRDRINADYRAARAACDRLSGNAKDICVEEAKGKEKVAMAEMEYQRTGKADDLLKLENAKADAAYEVAKERCDDQSGNPRDVCMKEAKAAQVRAKSDAKARNSGAEARSDAAADKRDADYKLAVEKCDALSGDAKSACVANARARYSKD